MNKINIISMKLNIYVSPSGIFESNWIFYPINIRFIINAQYLDNIVSNIS